MSGTDPIKHIVLLMLENHSFDEMLGCFQALHPDLDGVDPANPRFNLTDKGEKIFQKPKQNYCMRFDPRHETEHVLQQIKDGNSGFIRDFAQSYPKSTVQDYETLMGYYPRGFLSALHTLAEDFTICDQWFSSLPGPTWPNRYFALSGTSSGYVQMPEGLAHPHLDTVEAQTQPTIFDRLNEKGRSWKIYYYDFPNSLSFANQRNAKNLACYYSIEDFFAADCKDAQSFPDFVLIEPKYFGIDQNDDHPPHNVMKAEKLVADVYNAIRSNAALWNDTLLVVVFDEHGGFFDHVTPPATIPPDDKHAEYDFMQAGVRVPALLVSPWVGKRVLHTRYDHTSVLKYMIDKWTLGSLGDRTKNANSIADGLNQSKAREDTIGFIRVPFSKLVQDDGLAIDQNAPSAHQDALHVLANHIGKVEGLDSPALGGGVGVLAFLSRVWENGSAWLGHALQRLGRLVASPGERVRQKRIDHTTGVVTQLVAQGRHKAG